MIAAFVIAGLVVFGGIFSGFPSFYIPPTITGSGSLASRQESFTGFTGVSISSGFRFTITQSGTYSVNVTTNSNLLNDVQVTQSGNILYVSVTPFNFFGFSSLQVTITMPDISTLDLSGGSTGTVNGFNSTHGFTVDASGGSSATVYGSASSLSLDGSGGSHIDLSGFHVTDAQVNLSGGAWSTINLSGRLDANVSGGSALYYIGSPTMGNISNTGFSTIAKR